MRCPFREPLMKLRYISGQCDVAEIVAAFRRHAFTQQAKGSLPGRWEDNLFVIEFQSDGCDFQELQEAFAAVIRRCERYVVDVEPGMFGLTYLGTRRTSDEAVIRGLALIETDTRHALAKVAQTVSDGHTRLSITECVIDEGDPDAQWRWLADSMSGYPGIQVNYSVEPWLRCVPRPC